MARTVEDMRTPRSLNVIGICVLVLSLGLWWAYQRTGDMRTLLAFFAVAAGGVALEPLFRLGARRRGQHLARGRHPVMRGRDGHKA
jgi:hypothetical protein